MILLCFRMVWKFADKQKSLKNGLQLSIYMWNKTRFDSSTGLLIFRGKKRKISRDFQGQSRGKIGRFRGIFAGKKSKFAENLADFVGFSQEKVKIRRKIDRLRGILAEKSQISKDFQGQIHRKIGRFHGETSPRNNQ